MIFLKFENERGGHAAIGAVTRPIGGDPGEMSGGN